MPRGDGTGPMGYGSMTGRATGYCAGYQSPGYMNPVFGRGIGRGGGGRGFGGGGGGRGMGFRRGAGWGGYAPDYGYGPAFYPGAAPYGAPPVQDEQQYLKEQSQMLQDQLENIQKRIDELAAQQARQE
ncbi:MAG: DUF5320 domain-containing protein [Planctomycetes bacterium]|nr:DUF5320 domain-containing protein [Planctomycetota bacterium]